MRSATPLALALFIVSSLPALAAEPSLFVSTDSALPDIELVSASADGISLEYTFHDLSLEQTTLGGESFQSIEIGGGGLIGDVGSPALPTFGRFVAVPGHSGVSVRITRLEEEEIPNVRLAPMQPDEPGEFAIDVASYSQDRFDSFEDATVGEPALLRDLRVVGLNVQPVHYNPARQLLHVVRKMRVDVEFTGEDLRNVPRLGARPIPPSFDELYESLVLNYSGPAAGESVTPGSYLVICPNDAGVISRLQPLLAWRQRIGYPTVLVTTTETGTSRTSIKSYIQNAYDNWEIPPEFVVLAGDADGTYPVATWFETLSGYGGEGDHPYTTLEGNDILADVHIGRLSYANYSDLELIVEKVVSYEETPSLQDPSWFRRACLMGDPSSSGQSTITANQWVKEKLLDLNYTAIDTIWTDPFVSQMTVALNRGDTVFSYRGYYGMSGWSNGLSEALNNGYQMPFAVVITCDTGSFSGGTARSEGLLRAGTVGDPGGAVAAIGTSTIGTHTRYNNCMHYGIFRGLLVEGMHRTGVALTRGKLEVYLNYYAVEPDRAEIWAHWNNLMGDPAIDVYSGYPASLTVTHPTTINYGANTMTVEVHAGPGSVGGAMVCAWKDGETHSVGYTDANGRVELPLTNTSIGDLLLTVTGHDKHAYTATIGAVSSSVYVGYLESTIDDDASGTSIGNGDGLASPGETIELPVRLRNFGLGMAPGVTAQLVSDDPYVTILDDTEAYGDMAGATTAWSPDDFDFAIDSHCPHGHVLRFHLDVTSGSDVWRSLIEIPVFAPALLVEGTTVYDGGNGRLDPGETAGLSVLLRNHGGTTALGVTATLSSSSQFVTIQDANGTMGDIIVDGTGDNVLDRFTVTADPGTYPGYAAAFSLALDYSGGITDTLEFLVQVGTQSSTDPVGPDLYGYYAFDDTDTNYPDAPTYEWIEIDNTLGGPGEKIVLGDYGTYQDRSKVIDLPFEFQYYGKRDTRATICSNGWLAMGSTYLTSYRNWTIPGAGGPDAMIAPFWDDLVETTGGGVFQWYDVAQHRWIVEWSEMRSEYGGSTETFQAILYDPAYYPTATGDGPIEFQYKTITVTDPVDGYATVGIENHEQNDGVLYTYFGQYTAGAAPLTAGRAITFLPIDNGPLGSLGGKVVNSSYGNAPIEGAEVVVLEPGRVFVTAADGSYSGLLSAGSYTVVAQFEGFEPDTTYGVVIAEGEASELDFALTDISGPSIATTPYPSTDDNVGPYPIHVSIVEPSGLDEAKLYYRANGSAFAALELVSQGGNEYVAEIPGQSYTTVVDYYVSARDGVGYESSDPAGAPTEHYSFFVAPMVDLLDDDFEVDNGWTVGDVDDTANTGIWERADPVGTIEDIYPVQPEDDHSADPGALCFITGNGTPGESAGTNDVDGGKTTLFSPVFDMEGDLSATVEYWYWYSNHRGNEPGVDSWVVEVTNDGTNWTPMQNTTQNTGEAWAFVSFQLDELIELTDHVQFRFIASDYGGGSLVEAGVDDFVLRSMNVEISGIEPEEASLAVGLGLSRPNPANPRTRISYNLASTSDVHLRVYDVSGRQVRTLVNGVMEAGVHEVDWDGRSDDAQRVASGIYFLRFEIPGRVEVRQISLLR
ncbi:MAG: C25 family cysteine peptidase [Candidatus Eisenbacteria bacterium]